MDELIEQKVSCPYCGELIDVLIDSSEDQQHYIEDCQVCCRPIEFHVSVAMNGEVDVFLNRDDD
ncbi:MAG: CPXCG motif-containing cysteine-rich protein [Pseudomonadales bacterium]|nr:CPXCG motif-containing cysteine-rich protein [Pseudomonadales bacterium]